MSTKESNFLQKIKSFSEESNLKLQKKSVLVACSGGVDSMVLLQLLSDLKEDFKIEKIGVIHCNFCLRTNESDKDEELVKNYAKENQIEFYTRKFQTEKIAQKQKKSIQITARKLRYDFFEEIAQKQSYDYVATAHHLSDSLETSLYYLAKGSGVAGVRGILPKRKSENQGFSFIRPLLCLTKTEILEYAKEQQISWREDASNQTLKYKRNFIRHQIVPKFKEINPNVEQTFLDTSERLRNLEQLLQNQVQIFEKQLIYSSKENQVKGSIQIPLKVLQKLEQPLLILSEFLKRYNYSYKQVKQIVEQIKGKQSETKTFYSPSNILYTQGNYWKLLLLETEKQDDENKVREINKLNDGINNFEFQSSGIKVYLSFEICSREEVNFSSDAMYLELESLKFPLFLRKWNYGDNFSPLGMQGKTKKVGDFLTDLKVPIYDRKFVFVLLSENEIIWLGIQKNNRLKGLRISEKFKLQEKGEVMKIY